MDFSKVITIDGTTASGKGTLAKKLAKHFDLPYMNTGGLYRNVALFFYENNLDYNNKDLVISKLNVINFSDLDNPKLYVENIGIITSKISALQEVRDFLFNLQADFCKQENGAILDGRDIGTVICPKAKYKFFVVATPEARAERRYKEMLEKNIETDYNEILEKIKQRDKNDSERKISPLKKADDAVQIDTTNMNPDEVLSYALRFVDIQK